MLKFKVYKVISCIYNIMWIMGNWNCHCFNVTTNFVVVVHTSSYNVLVLD